MADPDWSPWPLDRLIGYEPGMSMPTVERHGAQWHPEFAHKCKPTEAGYYLWLAAMDVGRRVGRMKLSGIKDRRYVRAAKKWRKKIHQLINKGVFDLSDVPDAEKEHALEALTFAVVAFKDTDNSTKDRLSAAKLVLEFTKRKPAATVEATIRTAESILDELDD